MDTIYNISRIQPVNKYLLNGLMEVDTQQAIPLGPTEHELKTLLQLNLLMVQIRKSSEKGKCPKSDGYKVAEPTLGARTSYQKTLVHSSVGMSPLSAVHPAPVAIITKGISLKSQSPGPRRRSSEFQITVSGTQDSV